MIFFLFKQKTAYEMRISDWSSDVCSSDLRRSADRPPFARKVDGAGVLAVNAKILAKIRNRQRLTEQITLGEVDTMRAQPLHLRRGFHTPIGRASCRESVCQYV